MPEINLKQPRFTYSVCGPFTEKKERIQKFNETADIKYHSVILDQPPLLEGKKNPPPLTFPTPGSPRSWFPTPPQVKCF